MMLVMLYFLYHILLMYGMSHFWCNFIIPLCVLILNGLSKCHIFDTYFGLHNTVSVESLYNMISSFILTAFANE